jgi:hypothetical protein
MYLLNNDIVLHLTIPRWQFDPTGDRDDDAWVMVQLDVRHPNGSWNALDAALMFPEAQKLVEHLHREEDWDLLFLEPCLGFRRRDGLLLVTLSHELRPPWSESAVVLEFPSREAYEAAESLNHDLMSLPAR